MLWRTFQDRLVAELKLYQIDNIEDANEFLKHRFIPSFNLQFGVEANEAEKAYRRNIFGNLDLVFCKKLQRKIMSGNVFSWDSITWVVQEKSDFRGREINVNIHLNGDYSFDIMGRKVECRVLARKRLSDYGNRSKLNKPA